ncbi:chaperone protein dnaJ 2-like [Papaver somniferum]|uniref:chaperone protein dnaJ 2-like n=1 Tax=Papaver somniferum TaxID=3469 RepID=UPI000E6F7BD5|nr:chaperone protein dnaJ 2-like [Papaver somniferum]
MHTYNQYGEDALKEGMEGGGGGGRYPFDTFESVFGGGGGFGLEDGGRSRERMWYIVHTLNGFSRLKINFLFLGTHCVQIATVKSQRVGHQVDVTAAKVQELRYQPDKFGQGTCLSVQSAEAQVRSSTRKIW